MCVILALIVTQGCANGHDTTLSHHVTSHWDVTPIDVVIFFYQSNNCSIFLYFCDQLLLAIKILKLSIYLSI